MGVKTWKAWLMPGGLFLALAIVVVNTPLLGKVSASLGFYYFAVFAFGLALAWRFHSSRLMFSLIVLLLAHRAVDFYTTQSPKGAGHTASTLVGFLLPLNFIALAWMKERGLVTAGIAPRFGLLFIQAVVVAVASRPETPRLLPSKPESAVPILVILSFLAGAGAMVYRFLRNHKPIETGFCWSLGAVFLWLRVSPTGVVADAYVATAGLILVASLVETSYVLAYHDELTGIRGRRAFNEALVSLDQQYAIAIVDIDHFKKFNDTYGHDVGDQVLRMVASRLTEVGGGGQAYRCGGEEFAIIFRDLSAKDAFEKLDILRETVQSSRFHVRGPERRSPERARGPDRRKPSRKKNSVQTFVQPTDDLSVTISIGVAEPTTRFRESEQVIQEADKALYRAKQAGRNRVELASAATPMRLTKSKRASARN
jgi:diguanylate cyclase (GGDEF)-like protein